ncbi:MAG: tRNA preQ1(34) S-adenosylmethionine ribosyltransferase-isomerase QueA [Gammaproteobacteria bacterium GWE2_37_16]|nr:MAG: tRNA preQ1(34) S-adenosylmethionine ribosyltransferase-isomerase QueA [Gammaproteobacteria bacterium GWE2_37_16]
MQHNLSDFDFSLPHELIAQYPLSERSASRLLCVNRENNTYQHLSFRDLPQLLNSGDLLVFNDTRVIPARIYAHKISGGKVEILVERILGEGKILAHVGANKPLKIGTSLVINDAVTAIIVDRQENLFILKFIVNEITKKQDINVIELLEQIGHIPLPPYIERTDDSTDLERYQTVFARQNGAVAAPTAGLHFDENLLQQLKGIGIDTAFVTLHVGAGTFQPVRVESILEHKMHAERVTVSPEVCEKILQTKKRGNRVVAVGTTVVRSLETAAQNGEIASFDGETGIFIYPGYKFRCVDAMITNFHLPKSTLLMLVAAFAGYDLIKEVYQEAVKEKYRFFSYGDAMLLGKF